MNDRFKFRVWYKPYKGCVEKRDDFVLLSDGILCEYDGIEIDSDNYVIEMCTGLRDKNGNLIYEGDLIKSPNNSHPLAVYHDVNGLWRCKENRPNGIWELPLYDMVRNYTVEIIGNIHEQAEQKD